MSSKNKQKKYSKNNTVVVENTQRFDRLDALRGLAMIWMTAFHFCFDLNYFGFMNQNFYEDSFWTYQRSCIVSLFLLCAGMGQAVAHTQGLSWPRFWKRWRQVAGAALIVTIGSYIVYPDSFIYFGVLHAIALMLIIMRLTANLQSTLWLLGFLVIALKFVIPYFFSIFPALEAFNQPLLNWIGIISYKPRTEDYVPLIPWLGVMWLGLSAGFLLLKDNTSILFGELPAKLKALAFLGRYSLSYYLIHQPVLFALIFSVKKIFY